MAIAQEQEFQVVALSRLRESPTNPRRHQNERAMKDLTESVRTHGVLVPLLVRPVDGALEIVAGGRRYRAAKAGGVASIPVRVRALTDLQAMELQVVENLQREDVHPLDEAEGYRTLITRAGYDVAALAEKVGKSISYVYQRLKLAELIPAAQKAFLAEEITAGHAILIARLQPSDQKRLLDHAIERYPDGIVQVDSVRSVARFIQDQILLDLHRAPWKKDDASLVPAAGPCTTCPKRTGNQPALFPEVGKKDTCTDPQCFAAKMAAYIDRRAAELVGETGGKVLRVSNEVGYSFNDEKALTKAGVVLRGRWIKAAAGSCEHLQRAIVVHGDARGQVLTVCATSSCKEHWQRAGGGLGVRSTREVAADRRRREVDRQKTEIRNRTLEAVLAKVRAPLPPEDLRSVAAGYLGALWYEYRKRIAQRHGFTPKKTRESYGYTHTDWEAPIKAHIAQADPAELAHFLLELVLIADQGGYRSGHRDELLDAAKRYKVNAGAIERQVKAEAAARAVQARAKKHKAKARVQTSADKARKKATGGA